VPQERGLARFVQKFKKLCVGEKQIITMKRRGSHGGWNVKSSSRVPYTGASGGVAWRRTSGRHPATLLRWRTHGHAIAIAPLLHTAPLSCRWRRYAVVLRVVSPAGATPEVPVARNSIAAAPRGDAFGVLATLVAAPAAGQDHEQDEDADGGGYADDKAPVAVYPGLDFLAEVGSLALTLLNVISFVVVGRERG
jgi:hypothetical protein